MTTPEGWPSSTPEDLAAVLRAARRIQAWMRGDGVPEYDGGDGPQAAIITLGALAADAALLAEDILGFGGEAGEIARRLETDDA
jgi:hypothetical protein